jgi:hypothetical protein
MGLNPLIVKRQINFGEIDCGVFGKDNFVETGVREAAKR